jgi:hypothetical protein
MFLFGDIACSEFIGMEIYFLDNLAHRYLLNALPVVSLFVVCAVFAEMSVEMSYFVF